MASQNVQDHYSGEDTGRGMAARILAALRAVNGSDAVVNPETLAPLDHFNARGVEATQELVALYNRRLARQSSISVVGSAAQRVGSRRGMDAQ